MLLPGLEPNAMKIHGTNFNSGIPNLSIFDLLEYIWSTGRTLGSLGGDLLWDFHWKE
jgi:hypothetical protein